MVDFETALSSSNVAGPGAYIMDATTRGTLKQKPKIAASTFPIYIWEKGNWNDGSDDGSINDCRAAYTNQISNHAVAFGKSKDLILGIWGGLDIVVDPYSQ